MGKIHNTYRRTRCIWAHGFRNLIHGWQTHVQQCHGQRVWQKKATCVCRKKRTQRREDLGKIIFSPAPTLRDLSPKSEWARASPWSITLQNLASKHLKLWENILGPVNAHNSWQIYCSAKFLSSIHLHNKLALDNVSVETVTQSH